ncbi:MAG: glycoside hydrolase family 2 TIM barrel-domain containing protein [bacterium]
MARRLAHGVAIVALLALGGGVLGASAAEARETVALDDGWRFQLAPRRACPNVPDGNAAWRAVRLPHTWNDVDTFDGVVDYARDRGCYRYQLKNEARFAGRVVRLRFLGAYAQARVWIDGRSLGRFDGDYTGFHVDVPGDSLAAKASTTIDVEVDNRASRRVLPGRPDPDYNLYGGLYREVYLDVLAPIHVEAEATFARPEPMNGSVWLVPVTVGIASERENDRVDLDLELIGPDGRSEARVSRTIEVWEETITPTTLDLGPLDSPARWSPDSPALHEVRIALRRGGTMIDEHRFSIGLRTARFDPERGFLLNGAPLRLRGANRHQDFPGMGSALPAGFQELDARILKEMGANFVRTSHYPQHPAFLDACDRLGIVVFEEIATWKTVGWGAFQDAAARMMRAMIERDRNHPSIALWGMMNEGRSKPMFERLKAIASEADPTRGVGYAEHRFERALSQDTAAIPDAIGLNYRPEKYPEFKRLFPRGSFFVSEHTNQSHTTRGDGAAELAQVRAIDADLDRMDALAWLGGTALWSLHDYGTERPKKKTRTIHNSGAVDAFRIPRASFRYLATRWSREPRAELLLPPMNVARGPATGKTVVPIATNCARVRLTADGRDLGERPGRPLIEWLLDAPPSTVELRAECAGGPVEARWEKPGTAARIRLASDLETLPRDGSNAARITIRIEDERGRLATEFSDDVIVTTTAAGRAVTIGDRGRVPVAAGLGAFAVESTPGASHDVHVIVAHGGFEPANLRLRTR